MKRRKSTNYLNKSDLLVQIRLSKDNNNRMNDELAKMLTLLTKKYAKSSKYARYSYREDMEAFAVMMLVNTWYKFNEERSDNPFAFYTQCVKNSFVHFLKQEKKQRNVRDKILVKHGMNPSHTFMLEYEEEREAARLSISESGTTDTSGHVENKPLYE